MEEQPRLQNTPISVQPTRKLNPGFYMIGALIIFGLGLMGGYTLRNLQSEDIKPQVQQISPTDVQVSPTITDKTQETIKDLLQVQVPSGWIVRESNDTTSPYGKMLLLAPDLVPGAAGGPETNALGINFEVKSNQNQNDLDKIYQETYDEIHDLNPAGAVSHDLTRTTIANLPAISSYYDFEGHIHTYSVLNGTYLWTITIAAPSGDYEDQYKQEVDAVLSSIKFTK